MKDGLSSCSRKCRELDIPCPNTECRQWIDYEQDYNCTLVTVYEHGPLTLRAIAERLHLSFARIKQIEVAALTKLKRNPRARSLFF
jgi:hypothetical protein